MIKMTRLSLLLASLGLSLAACGQFPKSFSDRETMEFSASPYESTAGKAWPERTVVMRDFNARYGLPSNTQVTYVELNPEGEKTILFVHGLGSYLKFWRYQLDDFAAQNYRVIAIDLLGYGKSDKPATFPYTMESFADLLHEFVLVTDLDQPIIMGHSMGGHTALTYAIQYPDHVSALVLASPAGFEAFSTKEKAWLRRVLTVKAIQYAPESAIWGNIRRNNFYRWDSADEWLVEERVRVRGAKDFPAYAYANLKSIHGLLETNFTRDNLDRVKTKTLIVYGDMDRLIPNAYLHGGPTRNVMNFGATGIKGSQLVGLEGCGHTVQMDCALRYNAAVKGFLSTL